MTTRRAQEGGARWRQSEPHVYELRAGGAVLATVEEASWRFSVWSLADNSAGGWKKTTYAAMRAVRKALRDATDQAGS